MLPRREQLRPDAGGCFRPPQGSWKSGRKAIGRVSRYANQTYSSWGESGFPSEFLGALCDD